MSKSVTIFVHFTSYGWTASARGYERVYQISPRNLESAVMKCALLVFFGPKAAKNPTPQEVLSLRYRRYSLTRWVVQSFPADGLNLLPLEPIE